MKGGAFLYFPTVAAPITVSLQPSGVDELQAHPRHARRHLQRQDQDLERPRRSRPTTPARRCPPTPSWSCTGPTARAPRATSPSTSPRRRPRRGRSATGDTVTWPATRQAGQGNGGVAQMISRRRGAIGYVDFSDATASKLTFASIKNKAGEFVAPTSTAPPAAGAAPPSSPTSPTTRSTRPAPTPTRSPSATWIIVYAKQTDHNAAKRSRAASTTSLTDGQSWRRRRTSPRCRDLAAAGRRPARQAPDPPRRDPLTQLTAPQPSSVDDADAPPPGIGSWRARGQRLPLAHAARPRRRCWRSSRSSPSPPPSRRGRRSSTRASSFITSKVWAPQNDAVRRAGLHLRHASSPPTIALVIAVPVSIGIALFLDRAGAPAASAARWCTSIDLLAAVPSVVYGLWGVLVLGPKHPAHLPVDIDSVAASIPVLGAIFGRDGSGQSFMTAGIILAIMITPIITSVSPRGVRHRAPRRQGRGARPRRHPVGDDPARRPPLQPRRHRPAR